MISGIDSKAFSRANHFVILVHLSHPVITFILRNDLTSILHDDLTWIKCPITADPMPTVNGLDDFNSNVVFSSGFVTLAKILKTTVGAIVGTDVAICVITLIEHEAVETVFVTP